MTRRFFFGLNIREREKYKMVVCNNTTRKRIVRGVNNETIVINNPVVVPKTVLGLYFEYGPARARPRETQDEYTFRVRSQIDAHPPCPSRAGA